MQIGQSPSAHRISAVAVGSVAAIIALVMCFVLCYVLAKAGVRFFTGTETSGPSVLRSAWLNVYVTQHVPLVGAGTITDAAETTQKVSATILLPITVWVIVPIMSLLAGGLVVARLSPSVRWGTVSAVAGGLVYAVLMALLAGMVSGHIAPNLIPEVDGNSLNPPNILFHPNALSAFTYGILLGMPLMYCGVVLGRRERAGHDKIWHRTVKTVLLADLAILALVGTGFSIYASKSRDNAGNSSRSRLSEMAPAAAGATIALANGATFYAYAGSEISIDNMKTQLINLRANLYQGITREEGGKKSSDRLPLAMSVLAVAVPVVTGLICGLLASCGGALRTGSWATAIHLALVCSLIALCSLHLFSSIEIEDVFSRTTAIIGMKYSWAMIISFAFFFAAACLGAAIRGRKWANAQ